MLTLEGAQAGLSWRTILYKREGYRRAFASARPSWNDRRDRWGRDWRNDGRYYPDNDRYRR